MARTHTVLLLASLALAGAAIAGPLSIVAQSDPPSALPGIPVRLVLTVENTSDEPQLLPVRMAVQITPPDGEPFVPDNPTDGVTLYRLPEEYRNDRTIEPHRKRVFDLPLGTAVCSGVMFDSRLWSPGTYRLQLFLHDELRDSYVDEPGLDRLLGSGWISSPLLVSSVAELQVEKPAGTDAEIWSSILAETEGRGLLRNDPRKSSVTAQKLWPKAATSPYRPYLLDYITGTPEQLQAKWKELIASDPDHPVAEALRLATARIKTHDARSAKARGTSAAAADRQTQEARSELQALAASARHDLVRLRARNELAQMKTTVTPAGE